MVSAYLATAASTEERFSRTILHDFDFAYRTPEESTAQWCVKGDISKPKLPERWGTVSVVLRSELGAEKRYGNLGICKRILLVKSVLSVSNMPSKE